MAWEDIKWVVGEILIPIVLSIFGVSLLFVIKKVTSKSKIKGNKNIVIQNSKNMKIK